MIFIFAVVFDVASFVSEVNWNCPDIFTFPLSCDMQYFFVALSAKNSSSRVALHFVWAVVLFIFGHALYILYLSPVTVYLP